MSTKVIFSFLKISVTIIFYFLIIITLIVLFVAVINIIGTLNQSTSKLDTNAFTYNVLAVDFTKSESNVIYAKDSLLHFQPINNKYTLKVEPASGMGYYLLFMKMVLLSLGIAILWNFKKIFGEITLAQPFKNTITRRLKIVASLFIIADVLRIIDYFIFNSFLHRNIATPKFELLTEIGSDIITGLIIWIVAVIYERGTTLQEESALTV